MRVAGAKSLKKFKPDKHFKDIFSIDIVSLKEEGIKGLICDIDNTIVPWSEERVMEEVADWLTELDKKGFRICLVSNGREKRVAFFSKELGLPAVGRAVKPRKPAFEQASRKLGLKREEIAVIGDQIFTDIYGGNRMGFKTILVEPMAEREFIGTRIMRLFENMVYKRRERL